VKQSVYIDTTIPSYFFDNRKSFQYLITQTKNWWKFESIKYLLFTSNEAIAEANAGNYPNKEKCVLFLKKTKILPKHQMISEIAEIYMQNFLMPKELTGDAFHLSYASFYKIDFLLTWNCNHLANSNKKKHIQAINAKLNLFIPEIVTPLTLISEEN